MVRRRGHEAAAFPVLRCHGSDSFHVLHFPSCDTKLAGLCSYGNLARLDVSFATSELEEVEAASSTLEGAGSWLDWLLVERIQ